MAQNQPKELVTLRWMETSGVDHSANEEEGWAVMKAKNLTQGQLEKLIAAEEAIVAGQEALAKSLEKADQFLVDASDEVKTAVQTLVTHLEKEGVRDPVGDGDSGNLKEGGTVARIAMGIVQRLMGKSGSEEDKPVEETLKRLEENWPDFCKDVAGIVHGDGTVEAKQDEVNKAIEALQAKVLPTEKTE